MSESTPWYQKHFAGKRITKMGFGPQGRSFGDVLFLARMGAQITVTDYGSGPELLESQKRLESELVPKEYAQITFVFGEHRMSDFTDTDIVFVASGVPLESTYITAATEAGVPVFSSAAFVFDLIKRERLDVITIGVTGTKGKSTVTDMVRYMLQQAKTPFHAIGNIRGVSNLDVLLELAPQDIVLAELDSWQLQTFGTHKISPNVSIFTNFFPDHMDYYKGDMKRYFQDKSHIFRYQHPDDLCFVSQQAVEQVAIYAAEKPDVLVINTEALPVDIELTVLGEHNRENMALAYSVCSSLGISKDLLSDAARSYVSMEGRLSYLGVFKGVYFYDDNNSTTPDSTLKNLEAVHDHHKKERSSGGIIWLGGGSDKAFEYDSFASELPTYVQTAILFTGEATNKIIEKLPESFLGSAFVVESMEQAFEMVRQHAQEGDVVILSPAAASFGVFANEYDRGDQFNQMVNNFE